MCVGVGVEMCVIYADVSGKALPMIVLVPNRYWYRGSTSKQIKYKTEHWEKQIIPSQVANVIG